MTKITESPFIYQDTKQVMELGDICYYNSGTTNTKGSRRFKILKFNEVYARISVSEVNYDNIKEELRIFHDQTPSNFFRDPI